MDYIRKQIDQRIDFLKSMGDKSALKQHFQARFEYVLVYLMGYLWNKNIEKIDYVDREYVFKFITKPAIGSIVEICRKLDIKKEIFENGKLRKSIENYTSIRNEKIGHGFVFEDGADNLLSVLQELYDNVLSSNVQVLKENIDLIYISSLENNVYKGINYKHDGLNYTAWSCPKEINQFTVNSLYGCYGINNYFRLSPFIEVAPFGREFYIFCSIDEKLLGKVKYNRILETGFLFKEWSELCELDVINDGIKIKSYNGTIRNQYENNYRKYIDIGIKKKIRDFLTKKASVCATVWGHGGVGKTATIQSLCEDLANDERKIFDYIIFLSAKDRKYNYFEGRIEDIINRVTTLNEIIKGINKVVFNTDSEDPNEIINFTGKMILVVDDFETFSNEEKENISSFILQLDINHHKVVITTRANIIIGQELQTNELTDKETNKFLLEVIRNEELNNGEIIKRELENPDKAQKVFEITSGRPLFIFQFAFILGQKGFEDALIYNITESPNAINFLYGRIYDDYLSPKGKDLFVILSLLVTQDDLSNLIEKAQYILNLEHDIDKFNSVLKELEKLKIIKIDVEKKSFEIYSKEIFQIMSNYFDQREDTLKAEWISLRDQVNKGAGVEHSLLLTANANRLSKSEIEVTDDYRKIINRATSPTEVKLQAILNLAAYFVDLGKRNLALKNLDNYSHFFNNNVAKEKRYYATFTKMRATYYWANGTKEQKNKAIDILLSYAASGFNYKEDIDLELAGILLQYRSILVISEWEDLKERKKYNEIPALEFNEIRERQRQKCKVIHDKQGLILYNNILTKKIDDLSSGAKQNVFAGLYSFLDVLIRMQKNDLAQKICDYALYFAPKSFHPQYKNKNDTIHKNTYFKRPNNNPKPINKNFNTDFGDKLKDALKNKRM